MKIFEEARKINFVDSNNVFVGFDNETCCCEYFGWSITEAIPPAPTASTFEHVTGRHVEDLEDFCFDPSFIKHCKNPQKSGDPDNSVVFKLLNGSRSIYLTLFNSHNGYYGHGFEMEIGGETLHEGCL